jgi:hypothetical protein
MQEGFPFKKQITDRGLSIDLGGNGRYVYIICTISTVQRVVCYDSTLLTAANYAGAGTWTVNPFVSQINTTQGPTTLVYVPTRKEVWAISPSRVERINADPSSASFNTIVGSFTHTSGQPQVGVCYVSGHDVVLIGANNNPRILSCKSLSQIGTSFPFYQGSVDVSARTNIQCNHINQSVMVGGIANSICSVAFYTTSVNYSSLFSVYSGVGFNALSISGEYIIARTLTALQVWRIINGVYQRLATLSVTTASNVSRYARIGNAIYLPNGNNLRKIILEPVILDGGSLACGTSGNSAVFQANNGAIIISAISSGTTSQINVFNPSTDTYVGYITLPGTYDSLNSVNNHFSHCKNQLEI